MWNRVKHRKSADVFYRGLCKNCLERPFFAKIPCFSLFLTLSFVSRAQFFHKPKVKGFLHRQEYRTSHGNPMGCFFCPGIRGFLSATVPVYAQYSRHYCQNATGSIPCPKSRCQFILLFIVICGIIINKNKGNILLPFFIAPPPAGLFL